MMHRMPPQDSAEADKLKQLAECCEVILTGLQGDVQTEWHVKLIDKLTDMKNNVRGFDLCEDDFGSLITWALQNNNPGVLAALLNKVFSDSVLFEKIIKTRFFNALVNDEKSVIALLLEHSVYLRESIPTFKGTPTTLRHGSTGATMLQYAAMDGNTEVCKLLVSTFSGFEEIEDFYGNTCLHYAAISGNPACCEYFLGLHPEWAAHKNIFGHHPDDYLAANFDSLPRHEQGVLIDKFGKYLELEASEMTAAEVQGLCFGIAPVHALSILRGQQHHTDYCNMVDIISQWDGSPGKLANPVTDPHLNKLGINTINDVFLYLFSQYFYMFNMQFKDRTFMRFSRADIASQFACVNRSHDEVTSIFDHGEGNLTKDECLGILKRNIIPNVLIAISVGPEVVGLFNDEPGHQLCIAVDSDTNIFLCDPNSPYRAIEMEYKDLNKIANIAFRYNNNIKAIEVYKFTPALEYRSDLTSVVAANQSFFSSILASRVGRERDILSQACMADAPVTLRNLLDVIEQKTGAPPLNKIQYKYLVGVCLTYSSYRCIEILLNDYCQRKNISIDLALNRLGISDEDISRYQEYLQNKTIFKPTL